MSKKSCRNASATATLRFNELLRTTALSLLLFLPLHADEIFGRVVRVADGDTITILVSGDTRSVASETVGSRVPRDRSSERIRLHGIDAPERGQPFGRAAGRYLSGLVANRDVRVEYTNRDRYGRIVGIVFLDGCDINLEMLKAGLAWHYKHYDSTPAYAQAEAAARAARRGLWVDSNPILPEQFRHPGRARSPSAPLASTTVGSAPRAEYLHSGNTITVSYNGSVGEAFYQEVQFWASDDINVLYPKFKLTKQIAFFMIPYIRAIDKRYAFVDKWRLEVMEKDCILLPAIDKETPDYAAMERYIKSREKIVKVAVDALQSVADAIGPVPVGTVD